MATISFGGLISGLNTTEIIDAIMAAERIPVDQMEAKQEIYESKIEDYQSLNSYLLSLQVSVTQLSYASTFSGRSVTVSDGDYLGATITTSAKVGTYTIEIDQLATSQSISSDYISDPESAMGYEGDIIVDGVTISIESDDTYEDLVSKINNATSNVSASLLQTTDENYKLVLTAAQSGEGNIDLRDANDSGILESLGLTTDTFTLRNEITNGTQSEGYTSSTTALSELLNLTSPALSGSIVISDGTDTTTINIDLDDENTTLESIRDAINAEGNGITASIVEEEVDGETVYRLQIEGAGEIDFSSSDATGQNVLETLGFIQADIKK